jgi:hypothetical protein
LRSSRLAEKIEPEVVEEGVREGAWKALLDLARLGGIGDVGAAEVEDDFPDLGPRWRQSLKL